MKVVFDAKEVSMKKRRWNSLEQSDGGEKSEQSFNSSKIFKSKSSDGVQVTLNQLYKICDKEKVNVVEFFYTSVIPFNVIRILAFAKRDMIERYGVGYKPSYHDI